MHSVAHAFRCKLGLALALCAATSRHAPRFTIFYDSYFSVYYFFQFKNSNFKSKINSDILDKCIKRKSNIIFDAAHNPHAFKKIINQIKTLAAKKVKGRRRAYVRFEPANDIVG